MFMIMITTKTYVLLFMPSRQILTTSLRPHWNRWFISGKSFPFMAKQLSLVKYSDLPRCFDPAVSTSMGFSSINHPIYENTMGSSPDANPESYYIGTHPIRSH